MAHNGKINFKLNETPFLVSPDGDVVGIQSRSGAISYFPATVSQNAITATAGGGQANAVQLKYRNSRVTVVATIADSVKLPKAIAGMQLFVKNTAANSMNVFPFVGDAINAIAVDGAFAMAGATAARFVCMVNGTWDTII